MADADDPRADNDDDVGIGRMLQRGLTQEGFAVDWVRDLRHFWFADARIEDIPLKVARSGWSKQGGFELYFEGHTGADSLWDQLMEAGKDLDVRAGAPCQSERVEAGMLSYLSDITNDMTPYEAGLGALCSKNDVGCLGWQALQSQQEPERQIRPVEIFGDDLPPQQSFWNIVAGGEYVGRVSSSARAYDFECNASIALLNESHWDPGSRLEVLTPNGVREAVVREKFWGRF